MKEVCCYVLQVKSQGLMAVIYICDFMPQVMFLVRTVLSKREGWVLQAKKWKRRKACLMSRLCCSLPKAFFSDEIRKRPAHNWYSAIRRLFPVLVLGTNNKEEICALWTKGWFSEWEWHEHSDTVKRPLCGKHCGVRGKAENTG